MLCLCSRVTHPSSVCSSVLKGNPAKVLELWAEYPAIAAGYHLSKKHWNTLGVDQTTLSREWVLELITHSHAQVAAGLA